MEANVRETHDAEIDELRGRDETDEPAEHDGRVVGHLQEREQRDEQHGDDRVERHAVARAPGEDPGRLALEREAVQRARGAVHVRVAGGEGGSEHHGVDDIWEDADLQALHGDDVRGGGGAGRAGAEGCFQFFVVVGDWRIRKLKVVSQIKLLSL